MLTSLNVENAIPLWQKNLTAPQTYYYYYYYFFTGDFDGDGKDEALFNQQNLLYTFDDNSTMYNLTSLCLYNKGGKIVVVDWNGDGSEDIVQVYYDNTAQSFNVTVIYDLTGSNYESASYNYSTNSNYADIFAVVAGDFNASAKGPELAVALSSGSYYLFVIDSARWNEAKSGGVEPYLIGTFENQPYLYAIEDYLLFYYYYDGNTSLGVFRDRELWNHKYNMSVSALRVADFDLDLKPELMFRSYNFGYCVVDLESGGEVYESYVPIPLSIGADKKVAVGWTLYNYYTPYIMGMKAEETLRLISWGEMLLSFSPSLLVFDEHGRGESLLLLRSVYVWVCFDDYDGDGKLESLGLESLGLDSYGSSVMLVELNSVPMLTIDVPLIFYVAYSNYQAGNQLYFYFSVFVMVAGLGLTVFYYVRRRQRALMLDKELVEKA